MIDQPASLDRLRRLSRAFELLSLAGIVGLVALVAAALVLPQVSHILWESRLGALDGGAPVQPVGRILAVLVMAVPIAVAVYGLLAVRRLFAEFARGEILTERAAAHLQTFAVTVLLQAPLTPLVSAGMSLALTYANPPGSRALMISLSSHDYFALLVGAVLLAAATVMREAARLARENAAFV
ncbi:DUF2975 domain-containing protein [Amorphus orientalis]|uniref:DUF2975 domain-containing protein n=1 Tax=Amorphus orientalis TaxID=649198 RepID=A0AAE3VTF0_9HYPH|nr:DUF2975 domain-containing protein [Amorphus orientalis]MDQ0317271.1 hypothetical protein [Amorphus orientalis]